MTWVFGVTKAIRVFTIFVLLQPFCSLPYMDDLSIEVLTDTDISKLKAQLSVRFEMKHLGAASVCLGLQIHRDPGAKLLHRAQPAYTSSFLERFGMVHCKPYATPMDAAIDSKPAAQQ